MFLDNSKNNNQIFFLSIAALVLIAAWFIPNGRFLFYPLTLISTWFHEIGHAVGTWIIGGKVDSIHIYSNLSGVTNSMIPLGTGNIKQAIIAAGGPVMPSIIGSILLLSGRNQISAKLALLLLSGSMFISVVLLGNLSIGMLMIGLIAWGIGYSALKLNEDFLRILTQILGIEGGISIFSTFSYLSSDVSALINGQTFTSDTQFLASLVGSSHFFWAITLTAIPIVLMVFALLFSLGYFGRSKSSREEELPWKMDPSGY